jgi:prepilin-type N-terminal cleavage/methylation domain-containing protein
MRRRATSGFTLIEIAIVMLILALLIMLLMPNYVRARSQGRLTACETNLRNLASALEVYSTENDKRFPALLDVLVPHYIQSIPSCPSAGNSKCYTDGFECTLNPADYTISCRGGFHTDLGMASDRPMFQYGTGLKR